MRNILFFLFLFLVLPVGAWAASDVVATYVYSDGNMVTLCTRDSKQVRMDTSPTSYTLLSGGKVYSVTCDEGPCQVMDLGAMAGMASGLSMFGGGKTDVRYEKTGRTETIAGYKGTVYNVLVFEDGKQTSREEVVLSTHANLQKVNEGWLAIAEAMTQSMGQSFKDTLDESKKMGYGGMLRYGNQMRLKSLATKSLDSAYYKLPANAQQADYQQSSQQGDTLGLGSDAKEIGSDAKQTVKDEIKGGIRDTIRGLFE